MMNQIFVESKKNYYHGFVLREQELRRIIDLMLEQFKKLSNNAVTCEYKLKFKNGAFAKTVNLENVFGQENEGSSSIIHLQVYAKQENTEGEDSIKIDFRNLDVDDTNGEIPISHSIKGQSRDWVFVTSSLIEERITKIKRNSLNLFLSRGQGKLLFKLLALLFMGAISITCVVGLPNVANKIADQELKVINQIESNWKNKTISDPIDVIIQIEKMKTEKDVRLDGKTLLFGVFLSTPIIIAFSALIMLIIVTLLTAKLYPVYNFCWGNYIEIFSKKESVRKVIIGLILGSIILALLVNLLSNYIWEKM